MWLPHAVMESCELEQSEKELSLIFAALTVATNAKKVKSFIPFRRYVKVNFMVQEKSGLDSLFCLEAKK